MKTLLRVNEIYNNAVTAQEPLLSRYSASFWIPYLNSFATYDRLFNRLYMSFKYFVPRKDVTVEQGRLDFIEDVKAILTANNKKYDELFRLENLDDEVYNILDNYDMTETINRNGGNTRTENLGERKDNETISMTGTNTTKRDGTETTNYGEVSGDSTTNNPDITTTRENTVSAFDSSEYSPREKNTETVNKHAIDSVTHTDAHNDSVTTDATDTNTRDMTDTRDSTTGAQENTITDSNNETVETRRKGNIGVMTQSDVLMKHLELWDGYTFYQKIFGDIADLLLYV